jgi:hypothetical protein
MGHEHLTQDESYRDPFCHPSAGADHGSQHETLFRSLRLIGQARHNESLLRELRVKLGPDQLIGQHPAFLA